MPRCSCSGLLPLTTCLLLAIVVGCGEPAVRSYTVPRIAKHQPATTPGASQGPTAGTPQRMLGGIMLASEAAWFFKVSGEPAVIAKVEQPFKDWVASVKLDAKGNPTWTLPEDWKELAGNTFRFATLRMGSGDDAPELSISQLPYSGGADEYLLANINRWRGQLQLAPWTPADLKRDAQSLAAGEKKVTFVDFEGTSGGGMTPPFAGGRPPRESLTKAPPSTPSTPDDGGLTFTKPADWEQTAPTNAFAALAFSAGDEKAPLNITVSQLGGAAGGVAGNVNRWREQLKLARQDDAAIADSLKEIPSGLGAAKFVEIVNESDPPRAIFAAIIAADGTTYFVKAQGDAATAVKQRQNILDFVKSLKAK